MLKYGLNEKYPNYYGFDIKSLQNDSYFDFGSYGAELHVFLDSPSQQELEQIESGKIQMSVAYLHDVIMVLTKLGELDWIISAYSSHIAKANEETFNSNEIEDGCGYPFFIILVDSKTEIIKGIRLVSMPTEFSRTLQKTVEKQLDNTAFTPELYYFGVETIFNMYSSKTLLKKALITQELQAVR